jgi:RNA polymerase sigma-70 factor (ECF subfamily)
VNGGFVTTQWSRVLAARDGSDEQARQALESLFQAYWLPLFAFVRRQGHDPESASDLTQAYFTTLIEKGFLKAVEPSAGRFRSFLLTSLKHFLSHERDREQALKRGGGAHTFSLDAQAAEETLGPEPADHLTPEQIFERQWALTVLDRSLERLRMDSVKAGSETQFEILKPCLTGESSRGAYGDAAAELGMSEGAVRTAVHRLRKRFGAALRAEVRETVADPSEADDEIRYLLSVIQPWESEGP